MIKSTIGLECLLDTYGFCRILSLGPSVNSPELTNLHALLPPSSRLNVFIATTTLLTEAHPLILHTITSLSSAARDASITIDPLTILSSHSQHAHACNEPSSSILGVEAFSDYCELLQDDLLTTSLPSLKVEVKHFPLMACPILPWAFVIPTAADQASIMKADGGGGREDLSLLAHSLGSFVGQLGATSLETYHLSPPGLNSGPGSLSNAKSVAEELSSLPLPFPSHPPLPSPLTLILVDRGYDLASPCSKGGALLPFTSHTPPPNNAMDTSQPIPHPLDLAVASSPPLFPSYPPPSSSSSLSSSEGGENLPLAFLSLFDPHPFISPDLDPASTTYASWIQKMDQILSRRAKDVLPLLRKWLKEALKQEGLQPSQRSKAGSVTPDEIKGLVNDLLCFVKASPKNITDHSQPTLEDGKEEGGVMHRLGAFLRHSSLLSLSSSLVEASSSPSSSPSELLQRCMAACSLERQVVTLMVQSGDLAGLHTMLLDAFDQAKGNKGPLLVTDIIQILPIVYSLWPDACPPGASDKEEGPFTLQLEADLVRSAAQAIVAHLAAMLSKGPEMLSKGAEGLKGPGSSKAGEHLNFIPPLTLSSLVDMGRAGKEGKQAASKDIQRLLRAFLARLKTSASSRMRLLDESLR